MICSEKFPVHTAMVVYQDLTVLASEEAPLTLGFSYALMGVANIRKRIYEKIITLIFGQAPCELYSFEDLNFYCSRTSKYRKLTF
jgi:hypothetical protein